MSDTGVGAFMAGIMAGVVITAIGFLIAHLLSIDIHCGSGDWVIVSHENTETCYRFEDLPLDLRASLTEKR